MAVFDSAARKITAAAPLRLPQTVAAGLKAEAGAVVAVLQLGFHLRHEERALAWPKARPVGAVGPVTKSPRSPSTSSVLAFSSDDVVLDLNGATLDGTPTTTGAFSYGVRAVNHKHITVRNGTIKGFNYAVYLFSFLGDVDPRPSLNFLVEDIRAIRNRTGGLYVVGNDSQVRRNYVAGTGHSNDPIVVPTTRAIWAEGWGLRIVDNDVHNTRPNGERGGDAYAIYLAGVRDAVVVNNRITDASFGIFGQGPAPTWGKYRDNITVNVGVPYTGGTDIGNNN